MRDLTVETEPVLIAEDDLTSRLTMESFLRRLGYRPISASDGLQAWEILASSGSPSLAVIDWEMPGMDGLEVIRKVRKELPDRFFYLIMVTARNTKEEIIEGIGQGADDYVVKPFDSKELGVRIRAGYRIAQLQRQLVAANRKLEELAKTDRLTGFLNRLALQQDIERHSELPIAPAVSVSCIMADIDHFKAVNDTYGHEAGDKVLEQFADRVRKLLRQGDSVYRMGGEEFLIVAPQTDEVQGQVIAERIRRTVEEHPFDLSDGAQVRITCSLGISTSPAAEQFLGLEGQLKKADWALYQSKHGGRNRTTVFRETA